MSHAARRTADHRLFRGARWRHHPQAGTSGGGVEAGHGLLLVGYRGYGGNPGVPQETRMHRDMLALLHQAAQAGITPYGTILYGYSMGSAFAAHAAAHSQPLGVVLEAPISTFLAAVRLQAGRVPGFLVRTRFDNLARMREIRAPVLLLAGEQDPVTPPSFAFALARNNPEFASVEVVAGANHFNIMRLGGHRHVDEFLERLARPQGDRPRLPRTRHIEGREPRPEAGECYAT
jgi:uncharacterized protein